ncbi:MAG: hypothetical protein HUU55_00065 [Myxococcales bacterium]|nr:hypothetical protein [Myxococcales bacterium]
MKQPGSSVNSLILVGKANGLTVIPQPTPLSRLHYFDGKFLRADDLKKEQDYLRSLVRLSNQAGGSGVVHGYSVSLKSGGDALVICPGLAIDPTGDVLFMPTGQVELDIATLIELSLATTPAALPKASDKKNGSFSACEPVVVETPAPPTVNAGADLFLLLALPAEAYCGQEDVYGKVCEDACVTSTQKSSVEEGVLFRLVPLTLKTPLKVSSAVTLGELHLRSQVVSAYFADERELVASLIKAGALDSEVWCKGAQAPGGSGVPLGILARAGATTRFFDMWGGRRERIEPPPRRYWAQRMSFRPWEVYLAQILQFQCQLSLLLKSTVATASQATGDFDKALELLKELEQNYKDLLQKCLGIDVPIGDATPIAVLPKSLEDLQAVLIGGKEKAPYLTKKQMLIDGGIVELPPAGYLPVSPTAKLSVNDQVRALVGDGLDLRFCVVREDFVPHAIEEAQHMDRICLLQGLDNPLNKPEVDILVPDGTILSFETEAAKGAYQMTLDVAQGKNNTAFAPAKGVGRTEKVGDNGGAYYYSVRTEAFNEAGAAEPVFELVTTLQGPKSFEVQVGDARRIRPIGTNRVPLNELDININEIPLQPAYQIQQSANWGSLRVEKDPFTLLPNQTTPANLRMVGGAATTMDNVPISAIASVNIQGDFVVEKKQQLSADTTYVSGNLLATYQVSSQIGDKGTSYANGTVMAVEAIRKGNAQSGSCTVALTWPVTDSMKVTLQIEIGWGGAPRKVSIKSAFQVQVASTALAYVDNTKYTIAEPWMNGALTEDGNVLQPSNLFYKEAANGIEFLATLMGGGGATFKQLAMTTLFPPPPETQSTLVIQATKNWVAFHRRRTKACELEAPKAVAPSTITYKLLYAEVAQNSDYNLDYLLSTLQQGQFPTFMPILPFGDAQFYVGTTQLLTPASTVNTGFVALPPGNFVKAAVIATGPTETVALAVSQGRTNAIQTAISATADTTGSQVVLLPNIPAGSPLGITDGIILIVGESRRCHEVFHIPADAADLPAIEAEIKAGELDKLYGRAQAISENFASKAIGTVSFAMGQSVPKEGADDLAALWAQFQVGNVVLAAAIGQKGVAPESTALQADRGTAIAGIVDPVFVKNGGKASQVTVDKLQFTDAAGNLVTPLCPAVTFLVTGSAEPQLATVPLVSLQVYNPSMLPGNVFKLLQINSTLPNDPHETVLLQEPPHMTFSADKLISTGEMNALANFVAQSADGFNFGVYYGTSSLPAASVQTRLAELVAVVQSALGTGSFVDSASGIVPTKLFGADNLEINDPDVIIIVAVENG